MKIPLFNRWQKIILLFLVSLGLARASLQQENLILSYLLKENESSCSFYIKSDIDLDPIVSLNTKDSSLTLDFKGLGLDKKLKNVSFANRFINLGYFFAYPATEKISGLKLFFNQSGLKSIKKRQDGIELIIEKKSNHAQTMAFNSESLLNPEKGRYSPVVLKFDKVAALPLILNLAQRAGISLSFSGRLPENISVDMSVTSPLDGLKQITADIDARLLKSDQHYWLVGAEDEG